MKQPELGDKVKDLRAQRGFSQQQLADLCQIDVRSIQRIENGISKPRNSTLKLLSDSLEFDLYSYKDQNTWHTSRNKRRYLFSIIAFILLIMLISTLLLWNSHESSIAVLPFVELDEASKNENLSETITYNIIGHLSQSNIYEVLSYDSVVQYKNTKKSLSEIEEELNSDLILEGSIQIIDNRLRVTMGLMDINSRNHLWTEVYDRDLTDSLIYNDITKSITDVLHLE